MQRQHPDVTQLGAVPVGITMHGALLLLAVQQGQLLVACKGHNSMQMVAGPPHYHVQVSAAAVMMKCAAAQQHMLVSRPVPEAGDLAFRIQAQS